MRRASPGVFNGRRAGALAHVDLRGVDLKRPFLMVVRFLRLAGFDVVVTTDVRGMTKADQYAVAAFQDPHVRFAPLGVRGADLVISNDSSRAGGASRFLHLDFDIFSADPGASATHFIPICFHPIYLTAEIFRYASSVPLQTSRAIRIFFSGNFDGAAYDRDETRNLFGFLSRDGIIRSIRQRYGSSAISEPSSLGELEAGISKGSYKQSIVLVHSRKFRVEGSSWFSVLGNSDFVLSPPGIGPYCHNTVEAMAVGAIPILQYPMYYHPPLRHGTECIAFKDERELFEAVDGILSGAFSERLPQMHAATRNYFHEHLSPHAFGVFLGEFMTGPNRTGRLVVSQNTYSIGLHAAARSRGL
jgi:hypothetical protein